MNPQRATTTPPPITRPSAGLVAGFRELLQFDSVTCAAQAEPLLARTRALLDTEHVLQERVRQGARPGSLIDVDAVLAPTLDYQSRALKK